MLINRGFTAKACVQLGTQSNEMHHQLVLLTNNLKGHLNAFYIV